MFESQTFTMRGTTYTLAGGKGGVGKTTVTANVATALSGEGYDVAAVDLDLGMTNLGQVMDEPADRGVHQVLSGELTVEEVSVESEHGPTVVPGSTDIDAVGVADPSNLRRVVDPLAERHDIVLLDTGAGLSHQNCVAYGLADAVVLVSTPKQISVEDMQKTREMVEHVDGTVGGLVLTRSQGDFEPAELAAGTEADLFGVISEYGEAKEPIVSLGREREPAAEYERVATALAVYHQTGSQEQALAARGDLTDSEGSDPEPTETHDSSGLLGRVSSVFNS